MLQYGKKIIEKRRDFVRDLNDVIQDIHRNLTGGEEHLEVIYEPSTESECFEETLKKEEHGKEQKNNGISNDERITGACEE